MFQESLTDLQICLPYRVSGNIQVFQFNSKGIRSKEKVLCGGYVWKCRKEMGFKFAWNGNKVSGLTTRRTLKNYFV